jgi:hypothetical protein
MVLLASMTAGEETSAMFGRRKALMRAAAGQGQTGTDNLK